MTTAKKPRVRDVEDRILAKYGREAYSAFHAGRIEVRNFRARYPLSTTEDLLLLDKAVGVAGGILRSHWNETGAKGISRDRMMRYMMTVELNDPDQDTATKCRGLGLLFELVVGKR